MAGAGEDAGSGGVVIDSALQLSNAPSYDLNWECPLTTPVTIPEQTRSEQRPPGRSQLRTNFGVLVNPFMGGPDIRNKDPNPTAERTFDQCENFETDPRRG